MVRLLRRHRLRPRRGGRDPRGRHLDPVLVGGQQQDLAGAGRPGDPRGQPLAASGAGGHARHLLRHRAAAGAQADSTDTPRPAHRRALPAGGSGQGGRGGRDRRARPQFAVQPAGRQLARDRRAPARVPGPRAQARPARRAPAAAAVGCRQHRQRGARRLGRGRLPRPAGLYRGDPGRHARAASQRRAALGLGDLVLAQPRRHRRVQRPRGVLSRAHPAAPAGNLQPSRTDPPARLHRHERHDRGRPVRQRQQHPHRRQQDHERHRRQRRLRPQRLPVGVHGAEPGQGRCDLHHRADGQPRRPHRARCHGAGHRPGAGRPARAVTEAARGADHRPLRAPRLPAAAAGLFRTRQPRRLRPAHAASARRGAVLDRRFVETGSMRT